MILDYSSGIIAATLEKREKTLVNGVDFRLDVGESLALIGETGSGKTMLALSIMGLLPPNVTMREGHIGFRGIELLARRNIRTLLGRDIVYIPQNGHEYLDPSRKVGRQLYDNLKRLGVPKNELRNSAKLKLESAGLTAAEDILDMYSFQLSGGMAQRVTIAISACSQAKLIIADEPTNGLDSAAVASFFNLLDSVFPEAAKIIITHDIAVAKLCKTALVLCGGKMMERGPSTAVLGAPRHPYTKALISSLVKNGMAETQRLRDADARCPFYSRCAYADGGCVERLERRGSGKSEWWCGMQ